MYIIYWVFMAACLARFAYCLYKVNPVARIRKFFFKHND